MIKSRPRRDSLCLETMNKAVLSVLEVQEVKDLGLKLFRVVSGYGNDLANGVVRLAACAEFLRETGFLVGDGELGYTEELKEAGGKGGTRMEVARSILDGLDVRRELMEARARNDKARAEQLASLKNASEALWRSAVAGGYRGRKSTLPSHAPSLEGLKIDGGSNRGLFDQKEFITLFNECKTVGKEGLCFTNFMVVLLRISQLCYPLEFAQSPSGSVQQLFSNRILDYLQQHTPEAESDLKPPYKSIRGVDEIVESHSILLKKIFLHASAKDPSTTWNDAPVCRMTLEELMSLLSDAEVLPKMVGHQEVYRLFFLHCEDGPGKGNSGLSLPYSTFIDVLIRLSFAMFQVAPHNERLPTVASRFHCLLDRMAVLYSKVFKETFVPVQLRSHAPTVLSSDPHTGDSQGGYQVIITGSSFSLTQGVFVTVTDYPKKIIATEVKADCIKAVMPPCVGRMDFHCNVHLHDNNVYSMKVQFKKVVTLRASNNGVDFSRSGIEFTYTDFGGEFFLQEIQARMLAVYTEYCSKGDYVNDKHMLREKWELFRKEYGVEGGREWFDVHGLVREDTGIVYLTFRKFLLVLVSTLTDTVVAQQQEKGVIDNGACALGVADMLRTIFSPDSIDTSYTRSLNHTQSALTIQKIRSLTRSLSILHIVSHPRHDPSPDDPLSHPVEPEPGSVGSGLIVNHQETREMLIKYLKATKETEAHLLFEDWKVKQAKQTLPEVDQLPSTDVATVDKVEAASRKLFKTIHPPPDPGVPPDLQYLYEAAAPKGGLPMTPSLETVSPASADIDSFITTQPYSPAAVRGNLLDIFAKLAYDRVNQIMRRFSVTEGKLKSQIAMLQDALSAKDSEVQHLKEYTLKLRECCVTKDMMEREVFREGFLAIEKEMIRLEIEAKNMEAAKKEILEEEKRQEILDREREKILKEARGLVGKQESQFSSLIKLLANQTQWLESQKNVVIDLRSKLRTAEAHADSMYKFVTKLKTMNIPVTEISEIENQQKKLQDSLKTLQKQEAAAAKEQMKDATHSVFGGDTRSHVVSDLTYRVEMALHPGRQPPRPGRGDSTDYSQADLAALSEEMEREKARAVEEALQAAELKRKSEVEELERGHVKVVEEIKMEAGDRIRGLEQRIEETEAVLVETKETLEELRTSTAFLHQEEIARLQEQLEDERRRAEASEAARPSPLDIIPNGAHSAIVYITQPGDTLEALADQFDVTVDDLITQNPQVESFLEDEALPVKTGLVVPIPLSLLQAVADVRSLERDRKQEYMEHPISAHDTLSAIAVQYQIEVEVLRKANFLPETGDVDDPTYLAGIPTKRLRIPYLSSQLRKSVVEAEIQRGYEAVMESEKRFKEETERRVVEAMSGRSKTDELLSEIVQKQAQKIATIAKKVVMAEQKPSPPPPVTKDPDVVEEEKEEVAEPSVEPDTPTPVEPVSPVQERVEMMDAATSIDSGLEDTTEEAIPDELSTGQVEVEEVIEVQEEPVTPRVCCEESVRVEVESEAASVVGESEGGKEQRVVRRLDSGVVARVVEAKKEAERIRGCLADLKRYVKNSKRLVSTMGKEKMKELKERITTYEAARSPPPPSPPIEPSAPPPPLEQTGDSGGSDPSPTTTQRSLPTVVAGSTAQAPGFGIIPVYETPNTLPQATAKDVVSRSNPRTGSPKAPPTASIPIDLHIPMPLSENGQFWVEHSGFPLRSAQGFTAFTAHPPAGNPVPKDSAPVALSTTKIGSPEPRGGGQKAGSGVEYWRAKVGKDFKTVRRQCLCEEQEEFERILRQEGNQRAAMAKKMTAAGVMAEKMRVASETRGKLEYRTQRARHNLYKEEQMLREMVLKSRETIELTKERVKLAVVNGKAHTARSISLQKETWNLIAAKRNATHPDPIKRRLSQPPLYTTSDLPVVFPEIPRSQTPNAAPDLLIKKGLKMDIDPLTNPVLTDKQKNTVKNVLLLEKDGVLGGKEAFLASTPTEELIKNIAGLSTMDLPGKQRARAQRAAHDFLLEQLAAASKRNPRAWTPQPRVPTPEIITNPGLYYDIKPPLVPVLTGSVLPRLQRTV